MCLHDDPCENASSFESSDQGREGRDEAWRESVYVELRQLAEAAMKREKPGHSLQPTLILNDAYLRLMQQENVDPAHRSQVLAVGASIIRRLLVDYARQRRAAKRGGADGRGVPLQVSIGEDANHDVMDLHEALDLLESRNARAARVVELRFFGGLAVEEVATELDVSERTVANDWRYAKAWLYRQLRSETDGNHPHD